MAYGGSCVILSQMQKTKPKARVEDRIAKIEMMQKEVPILQMKAKVLQEAMVYEKSSTREKTTMGLSSTNKLVSNRGR
jgi:hypothetical protein